MAAVQLDLFPPPVPPPPPDLAEPTEEPAWVTGAVVDRSGMDAYTHLVRAPDDPERVDIRTLPEAIRDRKAAWRLSLAKQPASAFRDPILALLGDGVVRTFNRIGVELLDKTADVLFGLPPDHALWELVSEGLVEHTMTVPVFFRRRRPAA